MKKVRQGSIYRFALLCSTLCDMTTFSTFAQKLIELRERAELTPSELSAKSGVSLPYVVQLESGQRTNPRLPIRRRLAHALGVTAAELPASGTTTDNEQ